MFSSNTGRAFEDPELEPQKFEVGLELAQTGQVGVYHYHNPLTEKTCSIICQGGPKVTTLDIPALCVFENIVFNMAWVNCIHDGQC